jgi:hypothetical protein
MIAFWEEIKRRKNMSLPLSFSQYVERTNAKEDNKTGTRYEEWRKMQSDRRAFIYNLYIVSVAFSIYDMYLNLH